jgi:hypothetical protein
VRSTSSTPPTADHRCGGVDMVKKTKVKLALVAFLSLFSFQKHGERSENKDFFAINKFKFIRKLFAKSK